MQAFFAHRGDLCRICKDLPPPRAAVFVQKHNGTRIREAQLFGGETLLCFVKRPHFFYIVNRSAGYPRFFCRPQRRIAFIRLPFGLRPAFCQKQRARKEPGPGSRFVRRDEVSRKQQKKMRFCVFTKPHLWCSGTFGIRTFVLFFTVERQFSLSLIHTSKMPHRSASSVYIDQNHNCYVLCTASPQE